MRKFTADFETTTDEKDCRVWAYSICEIGNINNFIYGNNIEDFIKWCSNPKENYVIYFHNLKFDSEYIFSYLLSSGFTWIKDRKDRKDKTFTTLISSMGQFYSVEIFFEVGKYKTNKVTIYDSLKILNFSVDKIAKNFDLPIRKLKIDYDLYRPINHILTKEEIDYIRNDVEIMARALEIVFNENLTRMTIGSNALKNYRDNTKYFMRYFPEIPVEIDLDIRASYKGGFTYLSPLYKNKIVEKGIVLDVNSLYPSCMMYEYMPFGYPIYFEGKYKKDTLYPLYIQRLSCSFEIKKGKIPTIQIRNNLSFLPNEYVESSNDEIITLTLTNIDLELFLKHYNITSDIVYEGGWKFKKMRGLFQEYIEYWTEKKIEAKKNNNSALYQISKLLLNSLYGKFSKNPISRSKHPYLDEYGIVKYEIEDEEVGKGLYIPVGSFITALARKRTIESSQKIRDYSLKKYGEDYYIYSDTDSIHMKYMDEEELKQFLDIDDYRLGAWKLESRFRRGKFIRQKCYIEEQIINKEDYVKGTTPDEFGEIPSDSILYSKDENGYYKLCTTIAGLPKRLGKYIDFDNFNIGFSVLTTEIDKEHKLRYKHVKGGVLLVDTDFTIK